jgi:hypothetical protein
VWKPSFTIVHRGVIGTRYGWSELTLRFPFNYPTHEIERAVLDQCENFQLEVVRRGSPHVNVNLTIHKLPKLEAQITANVVLENPTRETYSVYFGSDYSTHGTGNRTFICQGPWTIAHLSDLRFFNYNPSEASVVELFDRSLIPESGVNVLSIANLVFIARTLTVNQSGRVLRSVRRRRRRYH